jgi:alkylation response protein AidB-like acyl-CoA dehydrogenase
MSSREEVLVALAEAIADPDHPTKTDTATWAREQLGQHDLVEADRRSEFAIDDWRRCADRGIFRLLVPTEMGGTGADLATVILTLVGLGLGSSDNGLTFAVASQMLSTQVALVRFATDDQRRRWLPNLLDGSSLAALAMTEPESGSDAFSMAARAERLDDGGYRLNGHKSYITFGPVCDLAIVFASTRPEAGSWGISAFLVDTSLPGVTRSDVRSKMGMRTTPFSLWPTTHCSAARAPVPGSSRRSSTPSAAMCLPPRSVRWNVRSTWRSSSPVVASKVGNRSAGTRRCRTGSWQ